MFWYHRFFFLPTGLPTSRVTGLHAVQPLRWAAGCWPAPRVDRWPLADRLGAPAAVR